MEVSLLPGPVVHVLDMEVASTGLYWRRMLIAAGVQDASAMRLLVGARTCCDEDLLVDGAIDYSTSRPAS